MVSLRSLIVFVFLEGVESNKKITEVKLLTENENKFFKKKERIWIYDRDNQRNERESFVLCFTVS